MNCDVLYKYKKRDETKTDNKKLVYQIFNIMKRRYGPQNSKKVLLNVYSMTNYHHQNFIRFFRRCERDVNRLVSLTMEEEDKILERKR